MAWLSFPLLTGRSNTVEGSTYLTTWSNIATYSGTGTTVVADVPLATGKRGNSIAPGEDTVNRAAPARGTGGNARSSGSHQRNTFREHHSSDPVPNTFMKPAGMVIVGIIGMMLFGWGTYDDIFSPPPRPLLESEVSYFRGRSSTAQAVPMGYGFVNFRVWLVDHPVAFQSAIHAGSKTFDIKVFKQLGPESEITIGVETSGLNAPGLDRRSNQKFLPFVSLESDKKSFSSLADYNERKNKGDESGLFHPILLVISMVTFGLGLLALLQGRSRMAG